jgi:hypothetical protein
MREDLFPQSIRDKYEIYDYKNAISILYTAYHETFFEICSVLDQIRITKSMIMARGGNESEIPKAFSNILRPLGWDEVKLKAETKVNDVETVRTETHKIDYLKDQIAFDLEWNSKDQTFDRDLYAFRSFFDFNKISMGIIVTRSTSLESYFSNLGSYTDRNGKIRRVKAKYGASTTHTNKLLYRVHEGRSGGCPLIIFGITEKVIVDM